MKSLNLWLPAAALSAIAITGGCKGGDASSGGYVPKKPTVLAPAVVPPGQEAKYFPMKLGNQWTFDSESNRNVNGRNQSSKQEMTYKIAKIAPSADGGQDVTFDISSGGKVVDRQSWRISKSGLYQIGLGMKLETFTSPQMVFPFPVKANETFKWAGSIKGDDGTLRKGTNEGTVEGIQPVDTDMGTFNALRIDSKGDLDTPETTSKVTSIIWFAPGVGIVRYLQDALGETKATDPKMKGKTIRFQLSQRMKLKNCSLK